MNALVIVPARFASSRLPGKPLIDLCGTPMIVRTCEQCLKAVPPEMLIVATDDERIKSVCEAAGLRVVMTSSNCLTGTDRVAEVARLIEADIYINVQGDEPLFNPDDLQLLIETALQHPEQVINGYCPIDDEASFRSSSIPKAVFRPDGRLLYMSRAPIPTDKKEEFHTAWRQVCAYAFPAKALNAFAAEKTKSPLEAIEDIEILRFLELGWEVKMIPMSATSIAVDTPDDVPKVERALLAASK